jgi:hypothetical protein
VVGLAIAIGFGPLADARQWFAARAMGGGCMLAFVGGRPSLSDGRLSAGLSFGVLLCCFSVLLVACSTIVQRD